MTVFRVKKGDKISAEAFNRLAEQSNPEVGTRDVPLRSKMIPCSVKNTSTNTIQAGCAVLATWRDEEADAETARRRFLRDGFCLKMVERYEIFSHRQRNQTEALYPYRRYIPVTLLRTAAPDKIVPGYVSGIFAATVRTNGPDKVVSEAYWNPDRSPYFFSRGEKFERADSAEYVYDVLAASAVKDAEINSSMRYDRFCILREKMPEPYVGVAYVESVDENGTITTFGGAEFNKGDYISAVDEIQRNDTFYVLEGKPISPVGLNRALDIIWSRFSTLSLFAYWVRDRLHPNVTYPGREPFPNWAKHNPWGDDGGSSGEGSGEGSGSGGEGDEGSSGGESPAGD